MDKRRQDAAARNGAGHVRHIARIIGKAADMKTGDRIVIAAAALLYGYVFLVRFLGIGYGG